MRENGSLYKLSFRKESDNMTEAASTAASAADITSVLDVLKVVFEFIIESLSTIVGVIMANPLLLIPIGVVLTYTIIRVFKALF